MRGFIALCLTSVAIVTAPGIGIGTLQAQTVPVTGDPDLTLPPELRAGEAHSTVTPPSRSKPHAQVTLKHKRSGPSSEESHAAPAHDGAHPDEHPVDLGVTMRGGSGAARAYAPTGDSEVLQESGSAFGAGMKFGF